MMQRLPPEELSQTIAIQFEDNYLEIAQREFEEFGDGSTMQSGAEGDAGASESGVSAQQAPRQQVAVQAVSSLQPATTMSVPSRSITMADPTADVVLPPSNAKSSTSDKFFEQPLEVSDRFETDRVEAFKEKPNPALQQKVTWHVSDNGSSDEGAPTTFDFADGKGTGTSGTGTGNGTGGKDPNGQGEDGGHDPFGDGSFPGGTGTGKGNAGNDSGYGQQGKGLKWGDFAGDGLFSRKVIKRADVARLATQQGKVVVNLCVDQLGKVVYAKYDLPNSSIRDKTIIAKAEECAKAYVFDEDPSAPREQCGRLTFIFEIKK